MAEQRLETTIAVTDKFSKTVMDFEKKLYHTLKPINSVQKSLKRLGEAFAFKELGRSFGMLKASSSDLLYNIKNIGQSFGYIRDAVVGVVNLLDKVTAKGDVLAKTSERLGFTVEELQKFQYVADLAGVSSENFVKGVKKLSESSIDAAGGSKELRKGFSALGISIKNADGSIKTSQELLFALADRFAETGKRELSASEKIFAAQKLLGKSGTELITVLNQGSDAIRAQMDELSQLGIMDAEQAKKSAIYRDEVNRLKRAIDSLSISVAADLFGPMTESVKYLTEYMKNNREALVASIQPFINKIPEMVQVFTSALPGAVDAIMDVAKAVKTVVDFVGVKWPVLITVFSSVGVPLTMMVYSLVKSFAALLSTVARVTMFFGTRFSGTAVKTESRLNRLWATVRKTTSGFSRMGTSARVAGSNVKMIGRSALSSVGGLMKFLGAAYMLDSAIEHLFNKDENAYQKIGGFISDIPVVGAAWRAAGWDGGKVNFKDNSNLDLTRDLDVKSLEKSDLYKMATTKTINNNTHSTIDVNFNNVPRDAVSIKRYGYNDPAVYGFSMTPAF